MTAEVAGEESIRANREKVQSIVGASRNGLNTGWALIARTVAFSFLPAI